MKRSKTPQVVANEERGTEWQGCALPIRCGTSPKFRANIGALGASGVLPSVHFRANGRGCHMHFSEHKQVLHDEWNRAHAAPGKEVRHV